jgi:hypothetical protein
MTKTEMQNHLDIINKKLARLEADGEDANPMSIEHWEEKRLELICMMQNA